MARIRSIKPEFPEDETLGQVCREARLLFILLWTFADDLGRFRANPTLLKNKLFPYDDDLSAKTVDEWLSQLAVIKRIELYKHAGQAYGVIVNWSKHQRIDNAGKSTLPEPELAASRGEIPRDSASPPRALDPSPLFSRKGKERIGEEHSPRKEAATTKKTPIAEDFVLTEEMRDYAKSHGVDADWQFAKFCDSHRAKGNKFADWNAAWRTWVRNSVEFQAKSPPRASPIAEFQAPKKLNPALYQDQ